MDCVWGCYCSKGYLRNSYNGKCVAEGSCRNNKIVDVSPQIPGLFMSRHLHKPQPIAPCFGPQCGCHGPSCGGACYGSTCGSCYGSNCHGKPPSIDIYNNDEAYIIIILMLDMAIQPLIISIIQDKKIFQLSLVSLKLLVVEWGIYL